MIKPFSKKAFWGKMGVQTLHIGFATPKRHFLVRNRVVCLILRQNLCARLGCSLSQLPKKVAESLCAQGAKSRMRRTETPKPIWIKFYLVVYIAEVVNHTNFGDHRLRGIWMAGVKRVIDFDPLLTGHVILRMRSGRERIFYGNQW